MRRSQTRLLQCTRRFTTVVLALVFSSLATCGHARDRIWLKAEINGKPAKLIFDTGSENLALFSQAAAALGLTWTNQPFEGPHLLGQVNAGETVECTATMLGTTQKTTFWVIESPSFPTGLIDGLMGWSNVKHKVVRIDARLGVVTLLSYPPEDPTTWGTFNLQTNSGFLHLEVPHPGGNLIIAVDTGSEDGVRLAPDLWRAWRSANSNRPTTFEAYCTVKITDPIVTEEVWAKEFTLHGLHLTEVPVSEANPADVALGGAGYTATLGMAALARLVIIVDGPGGTAYIRPWNGPPSPYQHNRLGAVFTPRDSQGNDLLARVAPGSPAAEAGILNGDQLLRVDQTDVTKWRDASVDLPNWQSPAGTRFKLTLKRGNVTTNVTAVLRDILPPQ